MSSSNRITSVIKAVEECGKMYNFDVKEALRMLNVEVKVKEKVVVNVVEKSKYPLPFNGEKNENCCNGIVKNHGLYTQCEKKIKNFSNSKKGVVVSEYCKSCENQPYGNITDRLSVDLYDYKDPKGKSPKRYTEVLKKLKLTKEMIEEESKRLNISINPIHFEEVAENVKRGRPKSEKKVKDPTGKKGRPKKAKKVVEVNNDNEEEDLFATLVANALQPLKKVEPNSVEEAVEESLEESLEEAKEVALPKTDKKAKKVKEVDPVKEAEKQKKAEEKAAKEAEKQKKAEEKAAKEAEKQKKAEEKATKQAEKEEEADVVKKFEFEGKSYYKSKNTGVIYNMEQEVVGKWNEERNAIDFEEEEEEEEYDD